MKILMLLASHRKLGNSDIALQTAQQVLDSQNVAYEKIFLPQLNIKQCKGCLACVYQGNCSIEDDVTTLLEKILDSDGIIIAAPTYILSPVGLIKTLIDRSLMITKHLPALRGKTRYALTITSAGNAKWNPLGKEFLNQLALTYQYKIFESMEAFAPGPAEILLDDKFIEEIKNNTLGLVNAILNNQSVSHNRKNTCPNCLGNIFKIGEGGLVCPICLTKFDGYINNELTINNRNQHFFELEHRIKHTQEWIIPTKDYFLKKRKDIKNKLIEGSYKK